VTFENAVFSQPLCCPSRVTILRGRYPHNTGISANDEGAGRFKALDGSTVATWLDEAGYETALFGKYLNDYQDIPTYIPPGWDV
jgi:N-acetylglucosamine-6-sulfatase